jgi:hypothetical protein
MATTSFVDAVTQSSAAWAQDVDTATYSSLTGVAGTNTITAGGPKSFTLAIGQRFVFIPAATNTGAVTLNITPSGGSALGAKNIVAGGVALLGGELTQNATVMVVYDGTQFHLIGPYFGSNTWVPVLTFATPGDLAVAYSTQVGRIMRANNMLAYWATIITSSFAYTTASGNLLVTGLPSAAITVANMSSPGACLWSGITKANYTHISPTISSASSNILFSASGSGQVRTTVTAADVPTGSAVQLYIHGSYMVVI